MMLTVYYDEQCEVCIRCRRWMEGQALLVPVRFVSCRSPEAVARSARLRGILGEELVVVDDRGNTWVGSAAFRMCLWALASYRGWSYRLNGEWAERFFRTLSKNRHWIAALFEKHDQPCDGHCEVPIVPRSPYR